MVSCAHSFLSFLTTRDPIFRGCGLHIIHPLICNFFFLSPLFFLSFFLFFPFLLALSIRRRRRSQISSLTSPKPASYRLRSSSVSQWRSYRFRIQGIKDLSITILNIRSCSNGEKGTVSDWILRVLYSCYRYEHLTIRMLGVD